MVRDADKSHLSRTTVYYNDGSINKVTEVDPAQNKTTVKDILYDNDGQPKGLDIISTDSPIVRKLKGEAPVVVESPNRKDSILKKIGEFFSIQKKNVRTALPNFTAAAAARQTPGIFPEISTAAMRSAASCRESASNARS